jgi:hypothetical protein
MGKSRDFNRLLSKNFYRPIFMDIHMMARPFESNGKILLPCLKHYWIPPVNFGQFLQLRLMLSHP